MSKHTLFMVHGMGEQEDDWQKPGISELRKAWKTAKLDLKLGGTFDKFYEIHPYRYSDEFIDYWKEYSSNAEKLAQLDISGAPAIIKAVFKVASTSPSADNFLLTHLADVFLYATTGYNEKIAEELILELRNKNFDNYSIIAHSLGTRVVHDALQRGYSDDAQDYQLFGVPTVLLSAANVARLMSMNTSEFRGPGYKVFPSEFRDEGACRHMITTRHWLDVIGSIRPFKVHPSDIPQSFTSSNYLSKPLPPLDLFPGINLSSVSDFLSGVHSLENHLAHPSVYVPFFNRTLRPAQGDTPLISNTQYKKLLKDYQPKTPTGQLLQHVKAIRSELREIETETYADQIKSVKSIISNSQDLVGLLRALTEGEES